VSSFPGEGAMEKLKDLKLSDIFPLIGKLLGRYRKQIFLAIIIIIVMSGIIVLVSLKVFKILYARLPEEILDFSLDKELMVSTESWIPLKANIDQVIPIHLKKDLRAVLPIKEKLPILIDEDFTIPLDISLQVPIDQDVFVDDVLSLSTTLTIDSAEVKTRLWGQQVSLPVKGSFPVNIEVPFKRSIHVKDEVDFELKKEVTFHLKKNLEVPLDMKVEVNFPLDEVFSIPFTALIDADASLKGEVPFMVHFDFALDKDGKLTIK
jgi:hypothetical protein